ncbi:CHASE2 domain-containing protein [Chitinibacteraceae bacterium HSL-7]
MTRRYLLLFVIIALAALVDSLWLPLSQPVQRAGADWLQRQHVARQPASNDIVIVDIDQASLEAMHEEAGSWPWPRAIHAELLEQLAAQEPRAIVFDLLFNEPDQFRADSDAYFREVALAHRDVLYLPWLRLADGQGEPLSSLPATLGLLRTTTANKDTRVPLLLPTVLPKGAWRGGLINFVADNDGVGRHYLVYKHEQGWRLPSLPAAVVAGKGLALPALERIRLNWTQAHQRVSYADLYMDFNRSAPQRPAGEFKDKIILIGTAAPGLQDFRPTPLAPLYPGVEVLATALDNLQTGQWLHDVPPPFGLLLTVSLMALLTLGFIRHHHTLQLAALLLLASAACIGLSWWLLRQQLYFPTFTSLLWLWVYFWLAALLAYLAEKRRREQAVQQFGRFLDMRVVNQLVNEGNLNPQARASSQTITVLFSDIRGFTTLSESRTPEQVVDLLNRYFSRQVDVIFKHNGTLDKFIGDAIMAFWGAPVDNPRHADDAIAAALEMAEALQRFKQELGDDLPDFDVGIGIHTGPAVVGFIGSDARLDYTAIGDTVNLSSRIEGQTKGVARILVSAATRAAASADAFTFEDKGTFSVKGREEAVQLFEPARPST